MALRRFLPALLLLVLAPAGRADLVARQGAGSYPAADGARVLKPKGEAERLELAEGTTVAFAIQVPAAREVEGLDPAGWFLRFDLDVHAATELELTWAVGGGAGSSARAEAFLPVRGRDHGRWGGRIGDLGDLAASGGEVALELRARGGAATVGELLVTRHHEAPTRKLRGKENGKLGPDLLSSGMLGFSALTEHQHAAFSLLGVREGGPAAKAGARPGDVVVEVDGERLVPSSIAPGWKWFEESHEAVLGRAIQSALEDGRASVKLVVERESGLESLSLKLPLRGAPGALFPLSGEHAKRFREDLVGWAVREQRKNGTWPGTNAVNVAMGALALLGTDDRAHADAIERSVDFLLENNPEPSKMKGLAYWQLSFQGILFCELELKEGDGRFLPWIEEACNWLPTTTHESKWGTQAFGHGPDGLPYDNKALMAPTAHLLVFDALARRCGVESRVFEHVEPYVRHAWSDPDSGGHGAMGYNGSYRDKGEFWSRTGLVALAEVLRGDDAAMAPSLLVLMEERHPWMLNSHAYGEPGGALGLLSLSTVKRELLERIVPLYRWRFLNAWEPGHGLRYTSPHMGAPYMGEEAILNLSYLLLLATETGGLAIARQAEER